MAHEKKIIFIASAPESLLNFRLHLMKEFLKRGYSVIAVAPFSNQIQYQLNALGIMYYPVPLKRNGLNVFYDIRLLIQLFFLFKLDFI